MHSLTRGLFVGGILALSFTGTAEAQSVATQVVTVPAKASKCSAVTPVIYSSEVLPVETGSGLSCNVDADCGATEFCVRNGNTTAGICRNAGVVSRGDIHYAAGRELDVVLTTSLCTRVANVSMAGLGGDSIEGGASYSVVSTATSWGSSRTPALRHRVRLPMLNHGSGFSQPVVVMIGSQVGRVAPARYAFTLAEVAAVNAPLRITMAEETLRNSYVTAMYWQFGDGNEVWRRKDDGSRERIAYGLSWTPMTLSSATGQIASWVGTDLRIENGSIAFHMKYTGDGPICDGPVKVRGRFTLVPDGSDLVVQWLEEPKATANVDTLCAIGTLGLAELIAEILFNAYDIADEIEAEVKAEIETSISGQAGSDRFEVCPLCRVAGVTIGNGRVDLAVVLPVNSVRTNWFVSRGVDPTAQPAGAGLALPRDYWTPVTVGGTYEICRQAYGEPPSTCPRHVTDPTGISANWLGSTLPVPDPWTGPTQNSTAYYETRAKAWERLARVERFESSLPEPSAPVGAALVRAGDATSAGPRLAVVGGVVVPPRAGRSDRIAFGVNDLAVVPGGSAPMRGALESTVALATSASQSCTLFAPPGTNCSN